MDISFQHCKAFFALEEMIVSSSLLNHNVVDMDFFSFSLHMTSRIICDILMKVTNCSGKNFGKFWNVQSCAYFYFYRDVCIFCTNRWSMALYFQVPRQVEMSFNIIIVSQMNTCCLCSILYYWWRVTHKVENAIKSLILVTYSGWTPKYI